MSEDHPGLPAADSAEPRDAPAASATPASSRGAFERQLTSPHYERLRSRLIRIFARRGSPVPEELADETIARVAMRLDRITPGYHGDPARYFFGVARNVYLEQLREPRFSSLDDDAGLGATARPHPPATPDPSFDCLECCLNGLGAADRDLILGYYQHERSAKIDHRRLLADKLGLAPNALRIRAHRIRRRLAECVSACKAKKQSG